ncbi:exported hypothetical protein [Mesorhizobium plurifarium]|uniref:Uncharacterized protein n=1 Tax=Mesorhizobium plurifarium TaxID=69974 RepID=A0A090GA93_MESPL|nr:exported hypothetical protein [Mesorhizobium plurifarium]
MYISNAAKQAMIPTSKGAAVKVLIVSLFMVLATHASAEEPQRVTGKRPNITDNTQGRADADQDNAPKFALPVVVVESPDQARHTAEREAKSDEHDAKDLDAQERGADAAERGADATERQVKPAIAQAIFGFLGMLLLVVTVVYTIKATKAATIAANAAIQANKDSRDMFSEENRPWLIFDRPSVSVDASDGMLNIYFSVNVENIGKTPATDAVLHLDLTFTSLPVDSVVAVRKFGEKCCAPSTWENSHKLIFPGKSRPLYEIAGDAIDSGKPFVRLLYCVSYRGNGIERVLATAGEVMFDARVSENSDNPVDPYVDIKGYSFYGMGYAT